MKPLTLTHPGVDLRRSIEFGGGDPGGMDWCPNRDILADAGMLGNPPQVAQLFEFSRWGAVKGVPILGVYDGPALREPPGIYSDDFGTVDRLISLSNDKPAEYLRLASRTTPYCANVGTRINQLIPQRLRLARANHWPVKGQKRASNTRKACLLKNWVITRSPIRFLVPDFIEPILRFYI